MPYEFLPEVAIADIAFRAWGPDVAEVFRAAGDAVTNAMIENLDAIRPRESRALQLSNDALDLLLFDLLQELIYFKDAEQLLLRLHRVQVEQREALYAVSAEARGEKLDPARHHQRVDVKAVTLHRFKLEQTPAGWEALVILDI